MSSPPTRLCLVIHNHQPVGNFDDVYQAAFADSYQPFLDVFEVFEGIRISLHTSGPLARWLDRNQPQYLDQLQRLVADGRIEIIGGAFYEPILTMIPAVDRVGQIRSFTEWLQARLGAEVRGMWIPERVWESNLTSDIARAGIDYTVLDDFHFRMAGIDQETLHGYFHTEDEGRLVAIFPGSETLRYTIPFADPQETIHHLRHIHEHHPGAVVTFGDDGEKFGTWPETYQHVYENGWLRSFFELLAQNQDWLQTSTLSEAFDQTSPRGVVYLPDCSYREMTEWSLPVGKQFEFKAVQQACDSLENSQQVRSFVRGGFWRNFKIKYREAMEMYSRMMFVSSNLQAAFQKYGDDPALSDARDHLYQAQCNCPYWHGAFGGIYLPHLRNAVYEHLIRSEESLHTISRGMTPWVEATASDFNFDGRNEVLLANDQLAAWVSPAEGGILYELDVREKHHNLLASMQRRPEVYHDLVRQGQGHGDDHAASIHDRVVFKQEGLDELLHYDQRPRKSLIDHFWDGSADAASIQAGNATEIADFADGVYTASILRKPERIQVQLVREGVVDQCPIKITKGLTLNAGSHQLEIAYLLDQIPAGREFQFGIEMNFAGMPSGLDDRFFHSAGTALGDLGQRLDLENITDISLVDQWLGLGASLNWDVPGNLWAFPVGTVSQSEGGFEWVHQSVAVIPHWKVQGDAHGRWALRMTMNLQTRLGNEFQNKLPSSLQPTTTGA